MNTLSSYIPSRNNLARPVSTPWLVAVAFIAVSLFLPSPASAEENFSLRAEVEYDDFSWKIRHYTVSVGSRTELWAYGRHIRSILFREGNETLDVVDVLAREYQTIGVDDFVIDVRLPSKDYIRDDKPIDELISRTGNTREFFGLNAQHYRLEGNGPNIDLWIVPETTHPPLALYQNFMALRPKFHLLQRVVRETNGLPVLIESKPLVGKDFSYRVTEIGTNTIPLTQLLVPKDVTFKGVGATMKGEGERGKEQSGRSAGEENR